MKNEILNYLRGEPKFRERANKDRGIVNLLLKRYPALEPFKSQLIDFVKDHNSMDRLWRQALEHHPDLRGNDYEDKIKLEQAKEVALGYSPSYNSDIKMLKLL